MSYLALTIGPIYKTMQNAKKTRQIWGASFFFSYIMKKIIEKLMNEKGMTQNDFITPYVEESKLNLQNGVGLFHDRMIFKSKNLNKNDFEKIVDSVLKQIEKDSNSYLKYEFLKNYLQIHIIKLNKEFKNPILDISPYLDSAELVFQAQLYNENLLLEYIKNRLNGSFLAQDAFGKNKISFPSLPKIALRSFVKEIDDNIDEQEYMERIIKQYKEEIKPYNKYIAVVQADGDNMRKVLEEIGKDNKKLKNFSKALFDFCIDSAKRVEDFGGQMIYAGGDDLLFFAPIANNKNTIFDLLSEISENFNSKIKEIELKTTPSISFGLSITYYKFPLYEARENAVDLLFNRAKSKNKNQIAYKVIKHSGKVFENTIKKDPFFENNFLRLISFEDLDSDFLHSLYLKIERFRAVLENIKNDEEKIRNFYKNFFDENVHNTKFKDFLKLMEDFTIKAFQNGKDLNYIYSTLRFKKFLIGDKE